MTPSHEIDPPAAPPSGLPRKEGYRLVGDEEFLSLQEKLREAQETLDAIRSGEVDAVVVTGESGAQIYTLTSADEPYRVYVEHMQEGAATISMAGVVLYSNRKFSELLEKKLEHVIGSDAHEHFGHEIWSVITAGLENSSVVKAEADLVREQGAPMPVMLTASRLQMGDQYVACLVITDLTAQKEKFAMAAAMKIAEEASRSKDNFIAVLSHELRTPLTPALMGACLLERETGLSERGKELVTMIRRNVEMEIRLIDDLLDITRITQGKIQLEIKPVDLHSLLRESVGICDQDIQERGHSVDFHLDARHSHIMGDPVRLQQIFWNLIRNACKFSPAGEAIVLTTVNTPEGGIAVSIVDRGVGIDPDMLPKLFSPFEQGGEEVTRRYGGLGLGLVISKSIAELHDGGGIVATSDGKGNGSTFTVTLRARPDLTPPPAREGTQLRVLLVEDNADTRMAMTMLLESMDYHVRVGDSVKRGIELAREDSYDFLISDLGLPDGTGYDLMREVGRHGLRGIAISGYGMPEDLQRSKAAGFDAHLVKPVSVSQLEAAIARISGKD